MQALQDFINKRNNIYLCIQKRDGLFYEKCRKNASQSMYNEVYIFGTKKKKGNNAVILQMNDGNQHNNQRKFPARGVAFGEVTKKKKGISNPPLGQVEKGGW